MIKECWQSNQYTKQNKKDDLRGMFEAWLPFPIQKRNQFLRTTSNVIMQITNFHNIIKINQLMLIRFSLDRYSYIGNIFLTFKFTNVIRNLKITDFGRQENKVQYTLNFFYRTFRIKNSHNYIFILLFIL